MKRQGSVCVEKRPTENQRVISQNNISNNQQLLQDFYDQNLSVRGQNTLRKGIVSETLDIGIFEGVIKNGKKNGKGVLKFNNSDLYFGDFENDELTGFGTYAFGNGDR